MLLADAQHTIALIFAFALAMNPDSQCFQIQLKHIEGLITIGYNFSYIHSEIKLKLTYTLQLYTLG